MTLTLRDLCGTAQDVGMPSMAELDRVRLVDVDDLDEWDDIPEVRKVADNPRCDGIGCDGCNGCT